MLIASHKPENYLSNGVLLCFAVVSMEQNGVVEVQMHFGHSAGNASESVHKDGSLYQSQCWFPRSF